jgi:hypothetical protein
LDKTPLCVIKNPLAVRVLHTLEDFIIQIATGLVVGSASRVSEELPGCQLATLVFSNKVHGCLRKVIGSDLG